jgi:hypothetical protein
MPFVNEIVSDEDIDKYELGFSKGGDHWWTRDADRDFYLWGGCTDFESLGEYIEGHFFLVVDGLKLELSILCGQWSKNWYVKPYIIVWDRILWVRPRDYGGISREFVVSVIKEALVVYGRDGEDNKNTPDRIVQFNF